MSVLLTGLMALGLHRLTEDVLESISVERREKNRNKVALAAHRLRREGWSD